ncbi:MAG: hypothetical protein HZA06_04180 [Nitrospirae bacterium]|nr:hypothetical protein [Nitrospirota bacterium]
MRSRIIEKLREEEKKAFLKLNPANRIFRMERLLYEVINIKAQEEGVLESEIYHRYLSRDKKRGHGI